MPNAKQIINELDQNNQQLAKKYTYSSNTNQNGAGTVFFKGLKPGSKCSVFLTATSPDEFQPHITSE